MIRRLIDEWLQEIEDAANGKDGVFLGFLTARVLYYLDANARFGRAHSRSNGDKEE